LGKIAENCDHNVDPSMYAYCTGTEYKNYDYMIITLFNLQLQRQRCSKQEGFLSRENNFYSKNAQCYSFTAVVL
jgi:hypothetical protein